MISMTVCREKNGPEFWKCWKSKFESKQNCVQVDGSIDDREIVDKFADYFSKAYSRNNASRVTEVDKTAHGVHVH